LKKLSEMRGRDRLVWKNIADCLQNTGKKEEAQKYYKLAESLGFRKSTV